MNYLKTIIYNIKKYLNLILHLQFKYKAGTSDVSADVLIKIDNYYISINYIFLPKKQNKTAANGISVCRCFMRLFYLKYI